MPRFAVIRKAVVDTLSGPRLVFHHVAKCGGTSVAQALRLRYAVSFAGFPSLPLYRTVGALHPDVDEVRRAQLVDDFQEELLLYHLFNDVRCLSGHVRFSELAYRLFAPGYKFITTLRDPISLMISHFFFQPQRPADLWTNVMDIDSYLAGAEARELGAIYSYFFNGLPTDADPRSPEAVARAKQNLGRFAAIGFVDDMAGFQRKLREEVGLRIRIGVANRSPASRAERASVITPEVRKRMEELSATNLEIYDFARREFGG